MGGVGIGSTVIGTVMVWGVLIASASDGGGRGRGAGQLAQHRVGKEVVGVEFGGSRKK